MVIMLTEQVRAHWAQAREPSALGVSVIDISGRMGTAVSA